MIAYIMFFKLKEAGNLLTETADTEKKVIQYCGSSLLTEIANTEKEVIQYCGQIISEGHYKLKKILKVNAEDNSVVECELKFLANEFYLDSDELPF